MMTEKTPASAGESSPLQQSTRASENTGQPGCSSKLCPEIPSDDIFGPPSVFVSYTHENPDHKRWVAQLATDLRAYGVDATLDQWDLQLGDDLTLFMEHGIREAARVLLVCTPAYMRKANEGEGGVGYERLVVTGELAQRIDTNKFICVLRLGRKEDAIPTFARTRLYIDFTDDGAYGVSLEQLLRAIHQAPAQPKPPIGVNPFKDGGQVIVERTRFVDRRPSVETTSDIEELYARATRLLRDKDLLGWKQLVRNVRSAVPQSLLSWRQDAEVSVHNSHDEWDQWFDAMHCACSNSAPLMVLALSAIDSEIEGLADQRGFLDDLLNIPQWERGGLNLVIEAPIGIAYVYHNILGSFLVSSNRHAEAIRLLRTKVPISVGSSHVEELWQSPGMMGWADSLGHKLTTGWHFLHAVWDKQPWLRHFFVRPEDLYVGIRVYLLLAGVLELAQYVSRGDDVTRLADPNNSHRFVPPVFATPISNTGNLPSLEKLLAMAVPDKSILDRITSEFDCDARRLREAWPLFYAGMIQASGQLFGHRLSVLLANNQREPPGLP